MDEYIEREALYEKAYWHGEHPDVGNPFPDGVDAIDIKDVDAIPAADIAPVRPELRKAVKELHKQYERAINNPAVRNPLAWALYRTWIQMTGGRDND